MADNRKPETIIRELKRHACQLAEGMNKVMRENDAWKRRALQAETDCAEWKRRFDLLLARTPSPDPREALRG